MRTLCGRASCCRSQGITCTDLRATSRRASDRDWQISPACIGCHASHSCVNTLEPGMSILMLQAIEIFNRAAMHVGSCCCERRCSYVRVSKLGYLMACVY